MEFVDPLGALGEADGSPTLALGHLSLRADLDPSAGLAHSPAPPLTAAGCAAPLANGHAPPTTPPEPARRSSRGLEPGLPAASPPRPSTFGSATALGAPATPLLAAEQVLLHEPLVLDLLEPGAPRPCALFITNHRVLVEPLPGTAAGAARGTLAVHVHAVSRLRRAHVPQGQVCEHGGQALEQRLDVLCRVGARPALRLQAADALVGRASELLRRLRAQCHLGLSFACAHALALRGAADEGWALYDYTAEFHRQGLLNPLSCWRVTDANRGYGLCGSYPPALAVPRAVSDEALGASAAFRSSRRFPALCWKDPQSFASISRAGQPLVGINGKRSAHDEALLRALLETNPECDSLAIVDCRPRLNAEANVLNGKGYESSSNYPGTTLQFVDIANIHVMRESMRRLLAALGASDEGSGEWLRELGGCGWLEHVQAVLRGSQTVVRLVLEHRSVLVHCSDGWDRTSQLTALAQLQLDPYFRTLRGFAVLVEKEWLAFGHQFALRHGSAVHAAASADGSPSGAPPPMPEDQQSPVFVQFIECVWQLSVGSPRAFEFSQLFLARVLEGLFSGRYGTFLLDSHQLRAHCQLPQRTRSLWSDLLDSPAHLNPYYEPAASPGALAHVDVSGSALEVWRAFYCRGPCAVHPDDPRDMAERALSERHRR